MKEELEIELVKKYPDIFRFHGGDPKKTCMAWGCEHDDGWYDLIDNLCEYITSVCRGDMVVKYREDYVKTDEEKKFEQESGLKNAHIPVPQPRFLQVKEKFAGLRIYFDMYDDTPIEQLEKYDNEDYCNQRDRYWNYVDNAIQFTEYLSHKTCEVCGKRGKVYRNGWWKTLCEDHKGDRIDISLDEMP
jgi:triacylglycerol esterase/lipase EstA (alpha/beta hydrolase family)